MKYTVRVDDTAHSVYQADFIENTTVSEIAEIDAVGYHIKYDEWDFSKRVYKPDFYKVYPKTLLKKDVPYHIKTLNDNWSTLVGLRKMLSSVNNKYLQQLIQKHYQILTTPVELLKSLVQLYEKIKHQS